MRNALLMLGALVLFSGAVFAEPYDAQLGPKIDAYLLSKGSPIAGNGSVFFASGVQYNVDPRLIVAISGAESSFGTVWAACPKSGFNAWSWIYSHTTCANSPFSSFADGIQTVTKYMRRWMNKGYTTIPAIEGHYCASGCAGWIPNTTQFYVALGGDTSDLSFNTTLIDFEQFSGSSVFTGIQPPLSVGIATISGGQILSQTTYLPADQSTVYGTADFCPGCDPIMTIAFSSPVQNFSVFLYNGETGTVTYTISDDKGDSQSVTLAANFDSGFTTVQLPAQGISTVTITSGGAPFDFEIDNIRFASQN